MIKIPIIELFSGYWLCSLNRVGEFGHCVMLAQSLAC